MVFYSLTDELDNVDKAMTAEENDIDCLFELCKEDFPFLSSEQQTINIGKFLHVSQIKEYQIRILSNIMPGLGEGWY